MPPKFIFSIQSHLFSGAAPRKRRKKYTVKEASEKNCSVSDERGGGSYGSSTSKFDKERSRIKDQVLIEDQGLIVSIA